MSKILVILLLVSTLVTTGLLAGCGGASSGAPDVTLMGVVHEPAAEVSALTAAATPAGNCQVIARQARTQAQLGSTRSDAQGNYTLSGLPLGEDVEITAALPSGDLLRTRLRLRDQTCQADLTEDSTMAAACRRLMDSTTVSPTQDDQTVDETVGQVCYEYQLQHRYMYRQQQGLRPNFSDPAEVEAAAEDLLASATQAAVNNALQTRTQAAGESAVNMVVAMLRYQEHLQFSWTAETRTQAALALRNQTRRSSGQVAAAASTTLGTPVTPGGVEQARDRLRQRLRVFDGASLEVLEACACLCLGDADMDQIRLRTQDQVRTCLNLLVAP